MSDAVGRRLRDLAVSRGLSVDVCAAAIVERALCVSDLVEITGGDAVIAAVDAAARRAAISKALPGAQAVYLRALLQPSGPANGPATDCVLLPSRLATRLLAFGGAEQLLANSDVDAAITWEIAAVTSGRTMSEWSSLAALAALIS